jgi:hypothetical protein
MTDSIRQAERTIKSTCRSLRRTSDRIRLALMHVTDGAAMPRIVGELRHAEQIICYGLLTLSRLPDEPDQRLAFLLNALDDMQTLSEVR